jgi:hypothetical protein
MRYELRFVAAALTLAALQAPPAALLAQAGNVPTRTLRQPDVEIPQPFSRIVGVRELSDGRVIVSDLTEKMIAIVDLTRRSVSRIGSEGQGPGEYVMPGGVMAMPGDTTFVVDMGGAKYMKVSPSGSIAGDVPFPQAAPVGGPGGANARVVSFSAGSGAVDAMGRIYSRGASFSAGPDGRLVPSDSAPITRWDWRSGKTDTVTFMTVPRPQIQQTSTPGGTNVAVRIGGNVPFVVQPAWSVAPDGRIAIITPEPYRVTWISATGQKSVGQPIAYQRIRVTEAEKEAFRTAFRNSPPTGVAMRVSDGGGRSITQSPVQFQEPTSWPEFKHPYASDQNAVMMSPSGELWISKQLAHTESNATYDLIGARGELTGRVVLPPMTRVIGFGRNGTVYTVRRDDSDLQYLQRFRLSQVGQ